MAKFASLVRLDAKAGKESEVEALLQSALSLVSAEGGIRAWFALKMAPRVYVVCSHRMIPPGPNCQVRCCSMHDAQHRNRSPQDSHFSIDGFGL
jgi:hypothetical protein